MDAAGSQELPVTEDRDDPNYASCTQMLNASVAHCSRVKTLLKALAARSCPAPPMACFRCDDAHGGGYHVSTGVVACQGRIQTQSLMDEVLTHELIHAYDECRVARIDWSNLRHHACSEIRAASLSGDCGFWNELQRGNVVGRGKAFKNQHAECVRRRAALSVAMNPACKSKEEAEAVVQETFHVCMKEWDPFFKEGPA